MAEVAKCRRSNAAAADTPPLARDEAVLKAAFLKHDRTSPRHRLGPHEHLRPARRHDDSLLHVMQDMALRMGEAAFLRQLALERRDGRPNLKDIKCPTLVIWSRQDELRSLDEAQELTNGIPNARLEIIENSGHMTPLEQPDELSRILRNWLTDADV